MLQLVIVIGVIVAAVIIAKVVGRPTSPVDSSTRIVVPIEIDRRHFPAGRRADWLVVVFTSSTCSTCAAMVTKARALESGDVAVVEAEATTDAELHRRYAISAVPIVLVADRAGRTRRLFIGPTTAAEMWSAMSDVRDERS